MTAYDPSLSRRSGRGFLSWLGLAPSNATQSDAQPRAEPAGGTDRDPTDLLRVARRQLVADIGDFLIANDLDINCFTLAVAHDYLTGADGRLMRRIDQQIQSREPITVDWLEQVSREDGNDQREVLARLMVKLETNIEEFGNTSTAAQSAASDYNSALAAHVGDLSGNSHAGNGNTGNVVGELVSLARAMMDRTRSLESEMSRSVLHTRALKRSLDQARRSAEQDHLTGLPNRRAFEIRFASEFNAAREAGDHLCVAFCDIDNFKRVNDEHGHEAGDRVLKTVATTLARISDDRCHVARHGGEEFVVLLRGRTLHEAWELLDETRAQLAERRLVNRATDTPFGKVTFSGGIADVYCFTDSRAALRAADRALYRAKAEGRNRIVVAERDVVPPEVTLG